MLAVRMASWNDDFSVSEESPYPDDSRRGWKLRELRSRTAWALRNRSLPALREELWELGRAARVSKIAQVFRCSKPTVMALVKAGFLTVARQRRRARRESVFLIEVASALEFVRLCHTSLHAPPLPPIEFSRIIARVRRDGTAFPYEKLPTKPSISEFAMYLRCSESTVLRMLRAGAWWGKRRSLRRWTIDKRRLPRWCREK